MKLVFGSIFLVILVEVNGVCLVEILSGGDSRAVTGPFQDGTYDVGLFQINEGNWCGRNRPGGRCNIRCESLLKEGGVRPAIHCLREIYNQMGFEAWYAYENECKYSYNKLDLASECGVFSWSSFWSRKKTKPD